MRTFLLRSTALACLVLAAGSASAGLFDDEEARRAILDLRQRVEAVKQDQVESIMRLAPVIAVVTIFFYLLQIIYIGYLEFRKT